MRKKVRKQSGRRSRTAGPPPLHEAGYHSLLTPATVARALLSLAATVSVVTSAVVAAWTFRVDDPIVTVDTTDVDLEGLADATVLVLLGVLSVTGVAFVTWAVRAYRNLPALAIEERRYWTIWLVIGWVIPGANLLVPKLLVDDLWRGSSPEAGVLGGDSWQRRPVASIVNRWWYSFLVTPAVVVFGAVVTRDGVDEAGQQWALGGLCVAAATAIVVAAVAARRMVAVVTVAQARRADMIVDLRESQRKAVDDLLAYERSRS